MAASCPTPEGMSNSWILRLENSVLTVLLGANTDQSLLLGFPLSCDCSNIQVMLYNPVTPKLLHNTLSHRSPSNPCSCSLSSFSLPLSPTTPFPFLWFPLWASFTSNHNSILSRLHHPFCCFCSISCEVWAVFLTMHQYIIQVFNST